MNKDLFYMKLCRTIAEQSYASRNQVGAILEKDGNILAFGYNGTPHGFDNICEIMTPEGLKTKPEVLHAESNAIAKCAKSTQSCSGATLYVNVAPCLECAKLIIQADISSIVYETEYRDPAGIELLLKAGLNVTRL